MKTTTIFAHKGFVGAVTDLVNGKFENTGNSMFRVNVSEIAITESAKEAIKNATLNATGVPMLIILADNTLSFNNAEKNFLGNDFTVNADADMSILDLIDVIADADYEIDPDFTEYVNEVSPGDYTAPVKTKPEVPATVATNLPEEGNTPVIEPPAKELKFGGHTKEEWIEMIENNVVAEVSAEVIEFIKPYEIKSGTPVEDLEPAIVTEQTPVIEEKSTNISDEKMAEIDAAAATLTDETPESQPLPKEVKAKPSK